MTSPEGPERRRMPPSGPALTNIDVEKIDGRKALVYGTGLFSGITTALFPLSVIKTNQMARIDVAPGFSGALQTSKMIWKSDGPAGFYRGFTTVIAGAVPARMLYLPTYEVVRSALRQRLAGAAPADAVAFLADGAGGAAAAVASSAVTVPLDVVSSRVMVHDRVAGAVGPPAAAGAHPAAAVRSPPAGAAAAVLARSGAGGAGPSDAAYRRSYASVASQLRGAGGMHMARHILVTEGVQGLYRGLGASIATYAPSSAAWWGFYGAYQSALWHGLYGAGVDVADGDVGSIAAVQAAAGMLAGTSSAVLTTPLDIVKTQLQIAGRSVETASLTTWQVIQRVHRQEGLAGFWRGFAPRVVNVALWGTCMTTAYEFLKRFCVADAAPPDH